MGERKARKARDVPLFPRITDPDEVLRRWEAHKASVKARGGTLPGWLEAHPSEWPPIMPADWTPPSPPPSAEHWASEPPPWLRDATTSGWEEHQDEPPGEGLRLMRERLGPPTGLKLRFIQVTAIRAPIKSMVSLKAARKKVVQLGEVVRGEAFDDWLASCVVSAQRPDEWTQARVLYEAYLRHASKYGNNREDKRLATEELATETQWGKMMRSMFPNKKRRHNGWYYPVRLKRGA